ncbi:hypothetical protein M3Y95_01062100 [Aphelenchoides besseyi]|nr:hypothetical protein M3Y95_01062100 [Aphelenchoides besseyi]
MFSTIDKSKR